MSARIKIGHTPNYATVYVGEVTYYFSYETCIAFHTWDTGTVVRKNDWGPTTGKHLNAIDGGDKASRIDGEEFQRRLDALTK